MSRKPAARKVAPCRGINAVGASIPSARFHTLQRTSLQADRGSFFVILTPEQREAKYQRETIEIARRLRERSVNGVILPIGAEW